MNEIISVLIGLLVGAAAGYSFFRYLMKKKYLRMIDNANREAEVIKEKKTPGSEGEVLKQKG